MEEMSSINNMMVSLHEEIESLRFLKLMGKMYTVWPLEDNGNKYLRFIYHFLSWFYLLNHFGAQGFSLLTCYHARGDYTLVGFAWMEFVSLAEAAVVIINYKIYYNHLKYLLINVEEYLATADAKRNAVLKEKTTSFAIILISITALYLALVVLYFAYPAATTWDSFLTTAYYPPSIRSPVSDIFLYFFQVVAMIHTSVMVNVDATVVLLIYVCTVRLKMLAIDFQDVTNIETLNDWIQEHQYILSLAEKTNTAVRLVISKTLICFISYTVGAGLQVTNPKATFDSIQRFGVVLLINYLRLIMCAMSGDELVSASKNIGTSVYFCDWYNDKDKKIKSTKIIIMMRCRSILKISVPGVMSTLDLAYITVIISTSISYFTTLRAIAQQ